jgi:hypothetical protein
MLRSLRKVLLLRDSLFCIDAQLLSEIKNRAPGDAFSRLPAGVTKRCRARSNVEARTFCDIAIGGQQDRRVGALVERLERPWSDPSGLKFFTVWSIAAFGARRVSTIRCERRSPRIRAVRRNSRAGVGVEAVDAIARIAEPHCDKVRAAHEHRHPRTRTDARIRRQHV